MGGVGPWLLSLLLISGSFCTLPGLPLIVSRSPSSSGSWRQGQIITNIPALPSLQNYLQETMARINPAIEELELGSMVPAFPFSDKDVNNVKFYLYTSLPLETDNKSESSESEEVEEELFVNDLSSVSSSSFDPKQQVKILIHGWNMSIKSKDFPGPLKDAYLEAFRKSGRQYNVVCVDWSALSREFLYFNSVLYAERVGRRVGELIMFLRLGGFISNFDDVHIIGFSLGAHVAAIAGNFVSKSTKEELKVGRITGLDPAGPGFSSDMALNQRLDSSDAKFVDVIHTNMGQLIKGEFGSPLSAGHADFYPNGGHRQPGCELSLLREYSVPRRGGCNHMRSIDFFVHSIQVPYLACKCVNWANYKNGSCKCSQKENRAFMGEHCDHRARGKYYLRAH